MSHHEAIRTDTREQAWYRMLLENTNDILVLTPADDHQILYITPSVLRVAGYTPDEYVALNPYDLLHPDDLPVMVAKVAEYQANNVDDAVSIARIRMKSGEYRWFESHIHAIKDAQGQITHLVHSSRDIHDRVLLEQELRQRTEELAEANAALARAVRVKDEFLANVSHELRTPLTAIIGLSEAMQLGIGGALNSEQLGMIATLEESGRHLLALINDVLDLAKIGIGKFELNRTMVDLDECCVMSVRLVAEAARKKKLRLTIDVDTEVRGVRADERRIKQMLVNLLSNAIKFTPSGGAIGLVVKGDTEAEQLLLSVWDTGIGIAPDDQERLFTPFVQVNRGLDRQHDGTGLGLALVKQMAELHGGRITVESAPGAGSRFTIVLPWPASDQALQPDTPVDASLKADSLPSLHGATVLLAEDNEILIALLTNMLENRGGLVVTARSGHEVLEQARALQPDVILMDVQMPGMDGIQATRQLRMSPETHAIPIIAVTALAMPEDRQRCLDAGMNEYLSKPISIETLVRAIERQLVASSRV